MRNQLKQFQWLKTNQSHFIRRGMGGIKEIMTFSNSIPHFGSKFPSSASSENNLNSPHVLCVRSLLCMCPTRVSVPATRTRNGKSESESLESSSFFCCCCCSFDDDDDAMAEKLDFVSWWHLQIERNAKYWFASTAAYPVPVSRVPVPNTPFLPDCLSPSLLGEFSWLMAEWVNGWVDRWKDGWGSAKSLCVGRRLSTVQEGDSQPVSPFMYNMFYYIAFIITTLVWCWNRNSKWKTGYTL